MFVCVCVCTCVCVCVCVYASALKWVCAGVEGASLLEEAFDVVAGGFLHLALNSSPKVLPAARNRLHTETSAKIFGMTNGDKCPFGLGSEPRAPDVARFVQVDPIEQVDRRQATVENVRQDLRIAKVRVGGHHAKVRMHRSCGTSRN